MIGKNTKAWKAAMARIRKKHPAYTLKHRRKLAGASMGGLRASGHMKKLRKLAKKKKR